MTQKVASDMTSPGGGETALAAPPGAVVPVPEEVIRREAEAAIDFALAALAPATRRAYRSDFRRFEAWCARRGLVALPADPETVATFLAAEASAGLKPATIARRSAAIRYAHGLDRQEPPTSTMRVPRSDSTQG